MPKSKKSALKGPKLFGKLLPCEHYADYTAWWVTTGELATIRKRGRTFEAEVTAGDMHFVSTSSDTFASAKKTLERRIMATIKALRALGWEPK